MQSGKSVGEVAQSHGMSVDAFRSALTQTAKDETAQAVATGTITQARADELNQRLKDNIGIVLNYQLEPGKSLPCRGYRRFGSYRNGEDSPALSPTPAASPGT